MQLTLPILLASLLFAAPALAQHKAHGHSGHHPAPTSASAAAVLSDGEVRKVDRDGARLTLKHGEIKNLGMPPMTMVFKVGSGTSLDALEPGVKVRFKAESVAGDLTVTHLEIVR